VDTKDLTIVQTDCLETLNDCARSMTAHQVAVLIGYDGALEHLVENALKGLYRKNRVSREIKRGKPTKYWIPKNERE